MQHPCTGTTAAQTNSGTHKHTHARTPALAEVYSSSLFMVASRLWSDWSLRLILVQIWGNWMTRGNHIGPRYDHIRGTSSNGCTKIKLDHVLPQSTGSLRTPSLLRPTFPLKDATTQLPASCFWQKQYTDVWQIVSAFICWYLVNSYIITLERTLLKVTHCRKVYLAFSFIPIASKTFRTSNKVWYQI